MKRTTIATDRLATAIVGLGALALGTGCAAWQLGRIPVPAGSTLQIRDVGGIVSAGWWPWALGVAAILMIALALRWLYAHRPGQSIGTATLPGSSAAGELTVDVDSAASAAAAALLQNPFVASASGKSRIDRGERIIEIDVALDPDPGALRAVTAAVDDVSADLAKALAGVPFNSRVLLRAPRKTESTRRVA